VLSSEGFVRLEQGGQLQAVMHEWRQEDVLLKLNSLEILGHLVESDQGFAYLTREHAVHSLCNTLSTEGLEEQVLAPGVLRLVAQIARRTPQNISALLEAGVLRGVTTRLGFPDTQALALAALGPLLASDAGLAAFVAQTPLAQILFDMAQAHNREIRLAAMEALTQGFDRRGHADAEASSKRLHEISQQLDALAGGAWIHLVVQQTHQPEEALICSAWALLSTLTQHCWGRLMVAGIPGLCEAMLDRTPTITKEAKEWKYDAICNMVLHLADVDTMLSTQLQNRLRQYKNDGAYSGNSQAIPVVGDTN